jgi:hypothetical protein
VRDVLVGLGASFVFGVVPAAVTAVVTHKLPRRRYLLVPLAVGLSMAMAVIIVG